MLMCWHPQRSETAQTWPDTQSRHWEARPYCSGDARPLWEHTLQLFHRRPGTRRCHNMLPLELRPDALAHTCLGRPKAVAGKGFRPMAPLKDAPKRRLHTAQESREVDVTVI